MKTVCTRLQRGDILLCIRSIINTTRELVIGISDDRRIGVEEHAETGCNELIFEAAK